MDTCASPTPWTVKGLVERKGRDCGEYCSRRRCRASSSSSLEFSSSDARTMSMQMIGRRSISVPGCDQNFPATGSGGSSALSPHPPPPPPLAPRETKGGRRRLTMARWHYVCRRRAPLFSNSLHSASAFPPPLPPSSSIFFLPHLPSQPRPARSAPRRSVPPVIRSSPDPLLLYPSSRLHSANCNRQSAGPLSPCSFSIQPFSFTVESSGKR